MSSVYEYTNKGKKYDFNTTVLSDEERKKFDGLTDKGKQRFIAAYQLSNSSAMPDEFSVASHVYDATNEPQNTYVNAQVKIDDIKSFLGNAPQTLKIPLYLKTEDQIYNAFYNKYVDEMNKLIPISFDAIKAEDGTTIYKPKDTTNGNIVHEWTTFKEDPNGIPKPLNQKRFFDLFYDYEDSEDPNKIGLPTSLENVKYILYYNVPELLKEAQHLTMSDIDNLLRINPKATTDDLINYLNQVQEKTNVYTKKNDLSTLLSSVLKHTDPKMFEKTLLYPISPETIAYILENYPKNKKMLKATEDNDLETIKEISKENNDDKLTEKIEKEEENLDETAKVTTTIINETKEEGEPDVTEEGMKKVIQDGKGETLIKLFYETAKNDMEKLANDLVKLKPELKVEMEGVFHNRKLKSTMLDVYSIIAYNELIKHYLDATEEQRNDALYKTITAEAFSVFKKHLFDSIDEEKRKSDKERAKRLEAKAHKFSDILQTALNIENLPPVGETANDEFDEIKMLKSYDEEAPRGRNNKKSQYTDIIYNLRQKEIGKQREKQVAEQALTPIRQREEQDALQGMGIFDRINKRITKDVNARVDALEKEVEQLKEMIKQQNVSQQTNIPPPPSPETEKETTQPAFAFDTSEFERQKRKLRPTEIIKHQPTDNEFQDSILKVMQERRKDIEPDEYVEDSDDDWGSGLKKKGKIKLTKFLKENEIESSDDY